MTVIYFLDCEFDGFRGPLISLALIREDYRPDRVKHRWSDQMEADAYYVFSKQASEPWVQQNVIPILWDCPFAGPRTVWNHDAAARDLAWFLKGDPNPIIVSDWPADIRYFCDLIELPGGKMVDIPRLGFRLARVDAYPTTVAGSVQHNAWWDAMALRERLKPLEHA